MNTFGGYSSMITKGCGRNNGRNGSCYLERREMMPRTFSISASQNFQS